MLQPWWRRPKGRTTALVNLAGIMERTDEQLLPAVYRFVGASFRATPSELGYLTLSRAMVQALASPVGGILGAWLVWLPASSTSAGYASCPTATLSRHCSGRLYPASGRGSSSSLGPGHGNM